MPPVPSVTSTTDWYSPAAAGVPVICPHELIEVPGGSPVALNRSVHPLSPSAAPTLNDTCSPARSDLAAGASSETAPWTCQADLAETAGRPGPVTVSVAA